MGGTEDEIALRLRDDGIAQLAAEKLLVLIPLAFGRILISHIAPVQQSHDFRVLRNGEPVTLQLRDEPFFAEALKVAAEMYHSGPRGLFEPAALMSAELGAVNKALDAGEDINGATLAPPTLHRLDFDAWMGGREFRAFTFRRLIRYFRRLLSRWRQ